MTPRYNGVRHGCNAPRGRGHFERIGARLGVLRVSGWLLLPGEPIDSFEIAVDGRPVATRRPHERPDVARVFPWCDSALRSGFAATAFAPALLRPGRHVVEAIGARGGSPVARLSTAFFRGFDAGLPTPPVELMTRVSNIDDPLTYWTGGLQNAGEYLAALEERLGPPGGKTILDWGSGCGRITEFLVRHRPGDAIHGCDIDASAVEWCRGAIRGARFEAVGLRPPTPYADESFDAIVSYSVLTHLERETQIVWLGEMRRLLKPGGVLLASVNGEFAASLARNPAIDAALVREGIADDIRDSNLDGVAPEGYYRAVYQREAYTRRAFERELAVLRYEARALSHLQDLVVLRKDAPAQPRLEKISR